MEPTEEKTSSSKVILSIIVILVVAAIAFAMIRDNDGSDMASTTGATTTDEVAGVFKGNMFNLVARGGDWKCTWETEQDGVNLEGTVYVSRGKFKSSVEMTGVGMNATAHAIGDGEFVYSWSSLLPTGLKFPMEEGSGAVAVSGTNAQEAQFTGEYNYDCNPWKADSGTFALPSGVTFSEAAAL